MPSSFHGRLLTTWVEKSFWVLHCSTKTRFKGDMAFVLMVKHAIVTQTRAAIRTIEFVGMANLMPAFSAFYTSVDELEHLKLPCWTPEIRLAGIERLFPSGQKKQTTPQSH